jgi:uncharacterized protein
MEIMMRRQDRAVSMEEALSLLNTAEYGVLSMCSPEGKGYGVPLNFVLDEDVIYFHCAKDGSKLDVIRSNNKVSFCVVGKTEVLPAKFGTLYQSVIAFGKAEEVEGEEKQKALIRILKKYSAAYMDEGYIYIEKLYDRVCVVKITIDRLTGKSRKQ